MPVSDRSGSGREVLRVESVSKSYGTVRALSDATLSVHAGEVVALLGPNGAGKTTLIRCITGYFRPDSGTVSVGGADIANEPLKGRSAIGYVPERMALYPELTVREHMELVLGAHSGSDPDMATRMESAAQRMDIADVLDRPVGQLSKGFRQRTGFALAISADPDLIVLDEPMNGLDPHQIVSARTTIRSLADASGVLLSTHSLDEAEELADRVVILSSGSVVADLAGAQLRGASTRVVVAGTVGETALRDLERVCTVSEQSQGPGSTALLLQDVPGNEPIVFDWAVRNGLRLLAIAPESAGLYELFAEHTGEADTP